MNAKLTIVRPGMLTTVQDYPGRVGYWQIGVPPSGRWTTCRFGWETPHSETPKRPRHRMRDGRTCHDVRRRHYGLHHRCPRCR